MKNKIAVLMTCYNRREKTLDCINSLVKGNKDIDFRFVVTDDNSNDGTREALRELPYRIKVLEGDGKLYWNGGMRKAIGFAQKCAEKFDYAFLVNDDVLFKKNSVIDMLNKLEKYDADAIVGATCNGRGEMTYGGVIRTSKHFARFKLMEPDEGDKKCDTFNCNAVLLKASVLKNAGNFDEKYTHSMGDYDYGITLNRLGYNVISSDDFVGNCDDNTDAGTWRDRTLSRRERFKLKESAKGLPRRDWYHFVRKNYGFFPAIYHSITPYIKILIKK